MMVRWFDDHDEVSSKDETRSRPMKIAAFFARGFAYLERFSVAWENFGLGSAVKLFFYCRWKPLPDGVSIHARKLGRRIVFRGKTDKGVMSHFFTPGFRIRDTPAHPVQVIVDAGANIGDETLRFRHFHPDAQIVAIEADAGNWKILSRNVASDAKTTVLHNGLWSRECRLRVVQGETAEAFRVEEVEDEARPADIEAVSVASILRRFSFETIDILKMDIEGAEYEVFSSPNVEAWIGRVKVLVFECPDADRAGATERIFAKTAGLDFDCHVQGECLVLIRRETGWKLESNAYL
jgi:FkbM family methyltransferase